MDEPKVGTPKQNIVSQMHDFAKLLTSIVAECAQGCSLEQLECSFIHQWNINPNVATHLFGFIDLEHFMKSDIMREYVNEMPSAFGSSVFLAKSAPLTEHTLDSRHFLAAQQIIHRKQQYLMELRKPENEKLFIEGKRRILRILMEMGAFERPVLFTDVENAYKKIYGVSLDADELARLFCQKMVAEELMNIFYKEFVMVKENPFTISLKCANTELSEKVSEVDRKHAVGFISDDLPSFLQNSVIFESSGKGTGESKTETVKFNSPTEWGHNLGVQGSGRSFKSFEYDRIDTYAQNDPRNKRDGALSLNHQPLQFSARKNFHSESEWTKSIPKSRRSLSVRENNFNRSTPVAFGLSKDGYRFNSNRLTFKTSPNGNFKSQSVSNIAEYENNSTQTPVDWLEHVLDELGIKNSMLPSKNFAVAKKSTGALLNSDGEVDLVLQLADLVEFIVKMHSPRPVLLNELPEIVGAVYGQHIDPAEDRHYRITWLELISKFKKHTIDVTDLVNGNKVLTYAINKRS